MLHRVMYIYIDTCAYIDINTYTYSYMYMSIYAHTYTYIFMCIKTHICLYVYEYVYINLYIYVCSAEALYSSARVFTTTSLSISYRGRALAIHPLPALLRFLLSRLSQRSGCFSRFFNRRRYARFSFPSVPGPDYDYRG